MKTIKYYLVILISFIIMVAPYIFFLLYAYTYNKNMTFLIIGAVAFAAMIVMSKPMQALRIRYRQDVEYDEFGRSKTKGTYEKLSKAERDAIDLQKTADIERVLDSTAVKKMTKKGDEHPEETLNSLIGLEPVKHKVKEMVARMKFEKSMKKDKKTNGSMSGRHMVFFGAPGTGKTTVARIITGFLYQQGYIKKNKCVEVDGNFLKMGEYSAQKTQLIIRQAYDGVLFVDEAYALMSGDGSGDAAIATLIKEMEDNRDRFILILAGYTNEMHMLLDRNPGFKSRIKEYLDFPDYNEIEMRQIFTNMAQEHNMVVAPDALDVLDVRMQKERRLNSFGNGRTARNVLDESIDRHALNLMEGKISQEDKYRICAIDISTQVKTI